MYECPSFWTPWVGYLWGICTPLAPKVPQQDGCSVTHNGKLFDNEPCWLSSVPCLTPHSHTDIPRLSHLHLNLCFRALLRTNFPPAERQHRSLFLKNNMCPLLPPRVTQMPLPTARRTTEVKSQRNTGPDEDKERLYPKGPATTTYSIYFQELGSSQGQDYESSWPQGWNTKVNKQECIDLESLSQDMVFSTLVRP